MPTQRLTQTGEIPNFKNFLFFFGRFLEKEIGKYKDREQVKILKQMMIDRKIVDCN